MYTVEFSYQFAYQEPALVTLPYAEYIDALDCYSRQAAGLAAGCSTIPGASGFVKLMIGQEQQLLFVFNTTA